MTGSTSSPGTSCRANQLPQRDRAADLVLICPAKTGPCQQQNATICETHGRALSYRAIFSIRMWLAIFRGMLRNNGNDFYSNALVHSHHSVSAQTGSTKAISLGWSLSDIRAQ